MNGSGHPSDTAEAVLFEGIAKSGSMLNSFPQDVGEGHTVTHSVPGSLSFQPPYAPPSIFAIPVPHPAATAGWRLVLLASPDQPPPNMGLLFPVTGLAPCFPVTLLVTTPVTQQAPGNGSKAEAE